MGELLLPNDTLRHVLGQSCAACERYEADVRARCSSYLACKAGKPLTYPPPFFRRRPFRSAPLVAERA